MAVQPVLVYPLVNQLTGFVQVIKSKNAATPIHFLNGNRHNQPQGKRGKDDGYIQPRGNPILLHQTTRKEAKVCDIRRKDYCQ